MIHTIEMYSTIAWLQQGNMRIWKPHLCSKPQREYNLNYMYTFI